MINWTHIILHHSASKDGTQLDFDNFRRYHVVDRKWRAVGYHFGVEQVEAGYEVIVGRPLTMQGSHAVGWNRKGIGIVFAGNFNDHEPDGQMIQVAVHRIIRPLCRIFGIGPTNVIGHGDTKQTDCPGHMFPIDRVRDLVA